MGYPHALSYNLGQSYRESDTSLFCVQELEQQLQAESETAQEQTEHLQSLLDEEKRLKEEANHDVLKTREVCNITRGLRKPPREMCNTPREVCNAPREV